jgi:hypothetical protein
MAALNYLPFPLRLLVIGKCESGKTTLAVEILRTKLRPRTDRLIVVCPSWSSQEMFREFDDMVNYERDVIEDPNDQTFSKILSEIRQQNKLCDQKGIARIRNTIFIDDLSGSTCLHGGRMSKIGTLAVNSRPLKTNMIVISHNVKNVAPLYRENCNALICFPSQTMEDRLVLYREFNGNHYKKGDFFEILDGSWEQGQGESERGKHFLFLVMPARSPAIYFSDFDVRLKKNAIRTFGEDVDE